MGMRGALECFSSPGAATDCTPDVRGTVPSVGARKSRLDEIRVDGSVERPATGESPRRSVWSSATTLGGTLCPPREKLDPHELGLARPRRGGARRCRNVRAMRRTRCASPRALVGRRNVFDIDYW